MFKEVIRTRKYKVGYELRTGIVDASDYGGKDFEMTKAFNVDGEYIGDSKMAHYLCKKRGIKPELIDNAHNVCSIGFCDTDNKWYGWSHRAICGFGVGNMIFEERFGDDNTPFISHGDKEILTFDDARVSASNFARYVS